MKYIARRISVTNEKGELLEISDQEFFRNEVPLVILGEPGAGKTKLMEQASLLHHVSCLPASTIEVLSDLNNQDSPILIDGVDEITAYQSGLAIRNILSKIPDTTNFILSCRAADWQDVINTKVITGKWRQEPIVGTILPLSNREIVDFTRLTREGVDAEEFLREAHRRDIVEMLRNPQHLILFLDAIENTGWPQNRLDLYNSASERLTQEDNEVHQSINRSLIPTESTIETAGFIFAQILLAGKVGIRLEGPKDTSYVHVSELAADQYTIDNIRTVLSTKLFSLSGKNRLISCHRTVAEFLAARWIATSLNNTLSLRRLETILYGNNFIVPAALRGLHAWIATLNQFVASQFIERYPYGFFRYGAPAALPNSLARKLLVELQKLAEFDPYFRNEDWYATFGKGLARDELRDDIVNIIRNEKSPYQLSLLILTSIQGDSFADSITDDLVELTADDAVTYAERRAALDALCQSNNQPNWLEIIHKLHAPDNVNSLRLALNVIEAHPKLLNGLIIADTLIALSDAMSREKDHHISGLAFRLHEHLTTDQLEKCLTLFSESLAESSRLYSSKESIEEWLYRFLQARLETEPLPVSEQVWSWLKNIETYSYGVAEWYKFSYRFFLQRTDYRQAIQTEILKGAANADTLGKLLWNIYDNYKELDLRETDLFFHLEQLIEDRAAYPDWVDRWRKLVHWGMIHKDFEGLYMKLAELHALQYPLLKPHLAKLTTPSGDDSYEKAQKERLEKQKLKKLDGIRKRHKSFENIKDNLKSGQHLQALYKVAAAYLRRYSGFSDDSNPLSRVTELVGEERVSIALEGLEAAVKKNKLTAREITELHANESKTYFIETILIAYCARELDEKTSLSHLPLEVVKPALASCRWELSFQDSSTSAVQDELEKIVFKSKEDKEAFFRDTIEPYLNHDGEPNFGPILGLNRLVEEELFSDIAKSLVTEWIERHPNVSSHTLQVLLSGAIRYSLDEAARLTRHFVTHEQWKSEDQRNIWMSTAFLIDFDHHKEILVAYASEDTERLWSLKTMTSPERKNRENWPNLGAAQNYFLIAHFGPYWPPANMPTGTTVGGQQPWEASEFISNRIYDLATDLSDEAELLLRKLIDADGLEGYRDRIKHVYQQQLRGRAEAKKVLPSSQDVKRILLEREPTSHNDFQALIIDELHYLQERIRNGSTNNILIYWNNETPHGENYCRDRIASALNLRLERYNIRAHTEGTMQNNTRCDLLCTHGQIDVPIEIKGQWHTDLWQAAWTQLNDYTHHYRANGRGIYVVLWFGYMGPKKNKNPYSGKGRRKPKTISEMEKLIAKEYADISENTKIFVLNLEQHKKVI